jgi:hypothetical protein
MCWNISENKFQMLIYSTFGLLFMVNALKYFWSVARFIFCNFWYWLHRWRFHTNTTLLRSIRVLERNRMKNYVTALVSTNPHFYNNRKILAAVHRKIMITAVLTTFLNICF